MLSPIVTLGGEIAEKLINYITSPELSREDLEFFSKPKTQYYSNYTTAESLAVYSSKIKRFSLTAKLLQLFPSFFNSCMLEVIVTFENLKAFLQELGTDRYLDLLKLSIRSIPLFKNNNNNNQDIPVPSISLHGILGISLAVLSSDSMEKLFSSFENEKEFPEFFEFSFKLLCKSDSQPSPPSVDIEFFYRNLAVFDEFQKVFHRFSISIDIDNLKVLNRIRFDPEYFPETADLQPFSSEYLEDFAFSAIKTGKEGCLKFILTRIVLEGESESLSVPLMKAFGIFSGGGHSVVLIS